MTENLNNKPKTRCAIYIRKSSEEGLKQEFNSLYVQRISGENFIAYKIGKGWAPIPDHYDFIIFKNLIIIISINPFLKAPKLFLDNQKTIQHD